MIKLIVGLGNPTAEYALTRHNAGFWFVNELAQHWQANWRNEKKFFGEMARAKYHDQDVFLLKPDTYMNLSGKAVVALALFYKILPEQILVVHDELDIPCGHIRYKFGGGNGGHNGLKDIQAKLGTPNFYRLRLGIDHPQDKKQVSAYVLSQPTTEQEQQLQQALKHALENLPLILDGKQEQATRQLHGFKPD